MIPDFPDDIRIRLARLKLYHEESLVSSYLNSNLFWFHCVRPSVGTKSTVGCYTRDTLTCDLCIMTLPPTKVVGLDDRGRPFSADDFDSCLGLQAPYNQPDP